VDAAGTSPNASDGFDLLVIGEINPDVVVTGPDIHPRFGQQEKVVEQIIISPGSSSVITACGAAKLGLRTAFAGAVGGDLFGRYMLDEMTERGVDVSACSVDLAASTGVSVVLSTRDDRATLTFPGVMATHRSDLVPPEMIRRARHVHLGSYFLQTAARRGLPELFAAARDDGVTTSLDCNWDPSDRWDGITQLIPLSDLFFLNENEARMITGLESAEAAAHALRQLGGERLSVIVKRGANGALLTSSRGVITLPALDVEVADTTGAGDSFNAGFLSGWLGNRPLAESLKLGVVCGSLSVRGVGGVEAQPAMSEALHYLPPGPPSPSRSDVSRAGRPRQPRKPRWTGSVPLLPAQPGSNHIDEEIVSQPDLWQLASGLADRLGPTGLPARGCRLAVIGCGTSHHVGRSFALARESRGHGETDVFTPQELPSGRRYDAVLAISRSGTTTEVAGALRQLSGRTRTFAVCAVGGTPVADAADAAVLVPEADEKSIVQTRFATTALALLRAHIGVDLGPVVEDGRRALSGALPADPRDFAHFVFLAQGWAVGLAHEAALKFQETANVWTESYLAPEYRHGPISLAGDRTLVWALGRVDSAVLRHVAGTGATVVRRDHDPMAELIAIQRAAVFLARARLLDPDHPRNLTRSVI
jgi:sugar/nucleoside kinase (ribokinase family)/fructoselysine-6-P-deglycase FrlB-like protein